MSKDTFVVKNKAGQDVAIEGHLCGNFGVNRWWGLSSNKKAKDWTVTHLASGIKLCDCPSFRCAMKIAKELTALGNHDFWRFAYVEEDLYKNRTFLEKVIETINKNLHSSRHVILKPKKIKRVRRAT